MEQIAVQIKREYGAINLVKFVLGGLLLCVNGTYAIRTFIEAPDSIVIGKQERIITLQSLIKPLILIYRGSKIAAVLGGKKGKREQDGF